MNSTTKRENTKESITRLADQAKVQINQNKYLMEIIEIFKQQISIVKNIITNYSLSATEKESNKSKYNLPLTYKKQLLLLNSKLKEEINKNLKKQENNINYILKDFSILNQTLSQFSIDNFILNNTINKYNNTIKTLNESIESSRKYDLFREPKRESELEIKESKNVFVVHNLESQQKMLSYCRDYVKYKTKNVKKQIKVNRYKNNISILKNIIRYYCTKIYGEEFKTLNNIINQKIENKEKINKIKNNNQVDIKKRIGTTPNNNILGKTEKKEKFKEKIKNIKINEEKKEKDSKEKKNNNNNNDNSFNKTSLIFENDTNLLKNIYKSETKDTNNNIEENKFERKKINILKIDELLDIENIEVKDEDIIDDELNSDDEVFFEKKVKPKKKLSTDFLPEIKKNIPSINLSQIEFNKLKVINEADAYSLQKRNFIQGNINGKIKNFKKQIKHLGKRISINKKKLDVIHSFIEDVKYNYRLLRPIKVQTSAAGNDVDYIREKLLDVVGESISQSEKKEIKIVHDKTKTGKTAVEEGEENDEEIVGSDYSDEEEYGENGANKRYEFDNKENENENIDKNKDNKIKENKKNNNKIKEKNNKIKTNLLTRFESDEKEGNILGSINAQSK